ncbi:hypothetical protein [Rhizobium ruizarguesonis]|uniref:hypothetical protein n=2 Tax=Rhizobium TaxID=379 RepID=UPI0010309D0E|nr:hypothetical protein [Rhizobium ruizarguesonis]NEI28705.1 hypothetical protein [Rhizobium ruizarguesonis]TAZ78156.1 hypothetical protein ELH68_10420 [Rhizobium ruizarguesonis]TBA42447.1 hypothetical protein ELH62_08815 [Rhizobium ruizarguesonis]TBA63879.1 hypothetical protein ELH57_09375 [Rhizobium ruizarguesonis]TBB66297.1 hypothetical protein ELH42_09070 [Rhizobium ruizarguesonis]
MTNEEKRIGRPIKEAEPGKRVSLGLKVTAAIKSKLDKAAREVGRTQSQEAEVRLERSFDEEATFGGPDVKRTLYLVAAHFGAAGQRAAMAAGRDDWKEDTWVNDPDCYRPAALAAMEALLFAQPNWTAEDVRLQIEALKGRAMSHLANAGIIKFKFGNDGEDRED